MVAFLIEWSLINEAKLSNDWFEQWAKAGAGPNYRVDNQKIISKVLIGFQIGLTCIFLIK